MKEDSEYVQLVKSLRWLANMFPEVHPAEDDADRMSNNIHLYCSKAADAIEELQAELNHIHEIMSMRRW